jgi:hypothetical protein
MWKKEILIIPLIICKHDPTKAAVENNHAALSKLFAAHFWVAAHHLGTPALVDISSYIIIKTWRQLLEFYVCSEWLYYPMI